MAALTREHIQVLLDQPGGHGMVVSCYADTSVAEGFQAHWLQRFKTEASQIRQLMAGDHQAHLEFERDLEAIRRALESPEARQARGMAVFSAAGRDFFLALPSEVPFEDRLVVGDEPYVVPLVEAYLRQRGYLVVLADTHRAALYGAGPGGSRLLDAIDEFVPKKQHSAGERWGKQQATIERHRKDHILHFHKELARRVEQAWDEHAYQGMILLGQREVLEQFRSLLPRHLAERVVHEAPHAWTEGQAEIDAEVRAVFDHGTGGAGAEHPGRIEGPRRGGLRHGHRAAGGDRGPAERPGRRADHRTGSRYGCVLLSWMPLPLRHQAGDMPLLR